MGSTPNNNQNLLQNSCNGYDTVYHKLIVPKSYRVKLFETLEKALVLNPYQKEGSLIGKLKNLRISFDGTVLKIQNSVPKYLYGQNFNLCSYSDYAAALSQLEVELGVPLAKARIEKLHFTLNIELDQPVECYLRLLGDSKMYIRGNFTRRSVYYSLESKMRVLNGYDKIWEMKNSGVFVPEILINRNILRFEIRYNKNVNNQINWSTLLTAESLCNQALFEILLNTIINEYKAIHKSTLIDLDTSDLSSLNFSESKKVIDVMLISEVGLGNVLAFVENLKKTESFKDKHIASRVKSSYKKLMKEGYSKRHPLIEELDSKVLNLTLAKPDTEDEKFISHRQFSHRQN